MEDRIMKKSFIFFAASLLALAGCSRNQEIDIQENGLSLFAKTELPADTKTVVESGVHVYWEPGDEIAVFMGEKSAKFATDITAASGTATFKGTFGDLSWPEVFDLWAVYPFSEDATFDGETITTVLPSEQIAREGSFGKDTNLAIAHSNSSTLQFYNVGGGVRFSLTQEGVKEVVFQGQNDEIVAGKIKIAFTDGIPAIKEVVEGQRAITLTAPNGGTFDTGKWYYIVALPGTLTGGFKMTFSTGTQSATLNSSGSKTIKRGIFGSQADADEDLIYKDKESGDPQTGNIVFADPAAKYACVAKYDTNGDGEVSIEEAEAATSFSGLFTNWKGVTSFDEIRYFKNVHSLSGVFNGCNKLVSITVPENITDLGTSAFSGCTLLSSVLLPSGINAIGNYTFQNCSSLSSIDVPPSVTSIGQYAFNGCSALTVFEFPSGVNAIANYAFQNCSSLVSVVIPSNVTSIGQYAFRGCSSLVSIDFPPQLNTIDQYAFSECSSLTQVVIPDGVTSLGNYVFSDCSKLSTANIPSGVASIPQGCFQNCSSLTSVFVPEGITSIGNNAFIGVVMWKLELPSSISSLGRNCLGSIVCILLPSTSPVAIQGDTFMGVQGIFVPSNMISLYAAMTYWSDFSSKLHSIDAYKEKIEFTFAVSGAVDMGVSVKWAAYNLGATKPEEYGGYYSWGEIKTKSSYNWSNYKWCNGGDYYKLTKYCPEDQTDFWGGTGTPDGKTVLDLADDAARANWGDSWRLPTDKEYSELRNGCLWEWTQYQGKNGYKVYSLGSGNVLFFPAAGYRFSSYLNNEDSRGYYMSSSLDLDRPFCSRYQELLIGRVSWSNTLSRCNGFSVRPVCE